MRRSTIDRVFIRLSKLMQTNSNAQKSKVEKGRETVSK